MCQLRISVFFYFTRQTLILNSFGPLLTRYTVTQISSFGPLLTQHTVTQIPSFGPLLTQHMVTRIPIILGLRLMDQGNIAGFRNSTDKSVVIAMCT